jgi:Kelch motif
MVDSNVFYIGYWVNFLLVLINTIFGLIGDTLGLTKEPPNYTTICDTNCGIWEGPYNTNGIIGTAAANLPDGRILIWSAYARTVFSWPELGDRGKTFTAIINPITKAVSEEQVEITDHDMFCPGTAYLPDQTIMVTGGTTSPRTSFYNPATETWSRGPDMNIGRGYHSMTLLGGMSLSQLCVDVS